VRWWWTMRMVSRWNRWKKCHSIIWLGESELERLVRGWRREAGSWLTHSSIDAAVIVLTFLAASYTLVWAQWTLYQIGLPVGKGTFEGACAGPCNVPPDECSASLQCLSPVQCIRRCDGWQDAEMQPLAIWLWTLVIKLLKYCAHIHTKVCCCLSTVSRVVVAAKSESISTRSAFTARSRTRCLEPRSRRDAHQKEQWSWWMSVAVELHTHYGQYIQVLNPHCPCSRAGCSVGTHYPCTAHKHGQC